MSARLMGLAKALLYPGKIKDVQLYPGKTSAGSVCSLASRQCGLTGCREIAGDHKTGVRLSIFVEARRDSYPGLFRVFR
jgi:hypothetical protein